MMKVSIFLGVLYWFLFCVCVFGFYFIPVMVFLLNVVDWEYNDKWIMDSRYLQVLVLRTVSLMSTSFVLLENAKAYKMKCPWSMRLQFHDESNKIFIDVSHIPILKRNMAFLNALRGKSYSFLMWTSSSHEWT